MIEMFCLRQVESEACLNFLNRLDCFHRHIWFALSVFFCDGKFLLEAVGILSLSNYSWTIGSQIVKFGKHGFDCLFSFMMENFCLRQVESGACQNILNQLVCFHRHTWFALFVFFCDGKFLLEAV